MKKSIRILSFIMLLTIVLIVAVSCTGGNKDKSSEAKDPSSGVATSAGESTPTPSGAPSDNTPDVPSDSTNSKLDVKNSGETNKVGWDD